MDARLDPSQHISWQRYWCARGASPAKSEDGFLLKGEEFDLSPNAKPVEQLSDVPCLVLLGSPGMGKTVALMDAYEADEGSKLFFDLGEFTEGFAASQSIFQDPQLREWLAAGEQGISLYLDSLDECMIDVPALGRVLGAGFRKLKGHAAVIKVRIACRVADWPAGLEDELTDVWGKENTSILELLPLRVNDVRTAATAFEVNPDAFLAAVEESHGGPLAAKPVTLLRLLLPEYVNNGALPASQVELYETGCLKLAEEWNPQVVQREQSTVGDVQDRLNAARYLATVMMFGACSAIDASNPRGRPVDNTIHVADVCPELGPGVEVDIRPRVASVEAVAQTALMARGQTASVYRFEHRSFQEYLCASHLARLSVPVEKLYALFSPDGKQVAPQLSEVAGWLASLNERFLELLMDRDPVVLLRADPTTKDANARRVLFERLCDLLRTRQDNDRDWDRFRTYAGIPYEGIETELRKILRDPTEPPQVREFAIDVVHYGRVDSLLEDLARIAIDPTASLDEREACARAIARSERESPEATEARARLRSLLEDSGSDDSAEHLRSYALDALWPDQITADEAFAVLRSPSERGRHTPLQMACQRIQQELGPSSLPAALHWASNQPKRYEMPYCFRDLMDAVFSLAWKHSDNPGVLSDLATAAATRLEHYEGLWRDDGRGSRDSSDPRGDLAADTRRVQNRRFCVAMCPHLAGTTNGAFNAEYWLQLLDSEDFEWALDQYGEETQHERREFWLAVSKQLWNRGEQHASLVRVRGRGDEGITNAYSESLALLDPNSPESMRLREQQAAWAEEMARKFPKEPPPEVSAAQLVGELLESQEAGDGTRWWEIVQFLTVEEGSRFYGNSLELHITKLPGWASSSPSRCEKIVQGARMYLQQANDSPESWVGGDFVHYPSIAGVKALVLLQEVGSGDFDELSRRVIGQWTNALLAYPNATSREVGEALRPLVALASTHAHQDFLRAVERQIRSVRRNADRVDVLYALDFDCSDDLKALLLSLAQDASLPTGCVEHILTELVRRGDSPARAYVNERLGALAICPEFSELESAQVEALAVPLLVNSIQPVEWSKVWRIMRSLPERGVALARAALGANPRIDELEMFRSLADEQVAEFCVWLREVYPAEQEARGARSWGIREMDRLGGLVGRLPGLLADRGTNEAIAALELIQQSLSEEWLNDVLIRARKVRRQASWDPIPPDDLCVYLGKANARLLRNEHDLRDATLEALGFVNSRLQGSPPRAQFLWDQTGDVYRPKDEASLSDWLAAELKDALEGRAVTVAREAEVRRGDETDIRVSVAAASGQLALELILEVKGCWNQGVETDIDEQLRSRYLRHSEVRHGIYVVGWYYCDSWDEEDYRSKRHDFEFRSRSVSEAQMHFAELAEQGTNEATIIDAIVLDCRFPSS